MERQEDTREIVARWLAGHRAAMLRAASSFADAVHGPEDIVSMAGVLALERHAEAPEVKKPAGWMVTFVKWVGLQSVRKRVRRAELEEAESLRGSADRGSSDADLVRAWQRAEMLDEQREQVLEVAPRLPRALRQLVHRMLIDKMGRRPDRRTLRDHAFRRPPTEDARGRGHPPRAEPPRSLSGSDQFGWASVAADSGRVLARACRRRHGPPKPRCHGSASSRHLLGRGARVVPDPVGQKRTRP